LVVAAGQSQVTAIAALLYIAARAGFLLTYWAGVNKLRSAFWGVGMLAIIATYAAAFVALAA
jgi:uncharacterized MAPEG superfamily protein